MRAGKRRSGMDLIAALLRREATRFHPVRAKAPLANAHSLSEISLRRSQNPGETTPGAWDCHPTPQSSHQTKPKTNNSIWPSFRDPLTVTEAVWTPSVRTRFPKLVVRFQIDRINAARKQTCRARYTPKFGTVPFLPAHGTAFVSGVVRAYRNQPIRNS